MRMNDETFALDIVYNGEKRTLNEEQAIELAQKGMNYDRLLEKYNEAVSKTKEADQYKTKIENLARASGTTAEGLMEMFDDNINQFAVSNFAEKENMPHMYAEKVMKLNEEIEALKKERAELLPIKKREDDIAAFNKEYPDVDVRTLDKAIIDEWENSEKSLTDIYNSFMVKKLLNKNLADEANEANKKASTGSVKDSSFSEKIFSDEEIRNMSDADIKKNFKLLMRQAAEKGEK